MSPTARRQQEVSSGTPFSDCSQRGDAANSESKDAEEEKTTPNEPDHDGEVSSEAAFPYVRGIPTLRSSAHRVRWSAKKNRHRRKDKPRGVKGETTLADGDGGGGISSRLPPSLRAEHLLKFDPEEYNLHDAVVDILSRSEAALLGGWPSDEEGEDDASAESRSKGVDRRKQLDAFRVPPRSLSRRDFGGQCEDAQRYLSDRMARDEAFLDAFDRLVTEVVAPDLKSRLIDCGLVPASASSKTTFYYQRPPTLRLQPGPSKSTVKAHRDSEYGHQDGELNFWVPLVDCSKSGCYLWTESEPDKGDYRPLLVKFGEMAAFHGSYCRHYVPANDTPHTRASLDFRIGIQGLYDPEWMMLGTKDDHSRRKVEI